MERNAAVEIDGFTFGTFPIFYRVFEAVEGFMVFKPHWHKRYELIYVTNGSMRVTIRSNEFLLKEGDICFIDTRLAHTGVSLSDNLRFEMIQVQMESVKELAQKYKELNAMLEHKFMIETVFRDKDIENIFSRAAEVYETRSSESGMIYYGLMCELMGRILFNHRAADTQPVRQNDDFSDVLKYLDAHYSEHITVAQLARDFSFEASYFSHKFKEIVGLPPNKYINILRLKAAEDTLVKSDLSVDIVSQRCGFESSNYFIRKFKERYGISPLQYRMLYRKKTVKSIRIDSGSLISYE